MSLRVIGNTRYGSEPRDLVAEITDKVPSYVQIDALKNAYPNGRIVRNEFYLGSLNGEAGQSLKINIDPSSSEFMRGMDFNTGDGIGGITKILMAAYSWKIKDVAEHFGTWLEKTKTEPPMNPINPALAQPQQEVQPEQIKQKRVIDYSTPYDGEYLYLSEDGEIIVAVRKYIERDQTGEIVRDNDGSAKKEFRQFPRLPETRPLYNLPQIKEADRVIWVEGEKCADALIKLGHTATCTIGGAGMLSQRTKDKFDFSPLHGKELIIWPDNDEAGQKLAKIVQELGVNAGAKAVTMLTPPQGKPKKWDAADAIEEAFDISKFLNAPNHKVKRTLSLKNRSLIIGNQFAGAPPEQKFLIGDTIPLGIPCVFAAAGDSGKGMMTLDLAMKVASGQPMQNSFGGLISHHGTAIILSAEDDRDELHRRVSRLDSSNNRSGYKT
jgi:5S rRNA maturation endonuclease (ribonuclease M5)